MSEQPVVSPGYPVRQWSKALTASGVTDPAVRQRAQERMRRWEGVLAGMADSSIKVGDRAPVAGLPAWVTLEVAHGGFATGRALAEVPVDVAERAVAERGGVASDRIGLFGHHLSDEGLEGLRSLVRSGGFRLAAPENAALPVVAWLLDDGRAEAAIGLIEAILPLAGRLRFAPHPHTAVALAPDLMYRETAGQVRETLQQRPANLRIAAMREALTIWNPFADEALAWWLESVGDDGSGGVTEEWLTRGRELLGRYRVLAAEHTLCTKHRKPKENLAILLSSMATVTAGGELTGRQNGLLHVVVEAMVRHRGVPGEDRHAELREQQGTIAALPTHHALVLVVIDRLAELPQDVGITDVDTVTVAVREHEPLLGEPIPAGAAIPTPVVRVVRRAMAGRIEDLVSLGIIGSAESLAQVVPQLTARAFAAAYPDPALRALMAALYRSFRMRRSLLLLNLQHQVRIGELPWVAALDDVRTGDARTEAESVLRDLGTLVVSAFPGTQLPNRITTELGVLSRSAELRLPWVEELAADIFMGVFSPKYQAASKIAAEQLAGSLYERYYGIDYARVLALPEADPAQRRGYTRLPSDFDKLCAARADAAGRIGSSVGANGMVIEQAQILTTHNLATLAGRCGVDPEQGWAALAEDAFEHMLRLARQLSHVRRPLPAIKDLAYAWRQVIFYLSMADVEPAEFLRTAYAKVERTGPVVAGMLTPVLSGLSAIADGEGFDADGRAGAGWQLLGWAVDGHWLRSWRD